MMLSYPFLEKPINFDSSKINVLIIENPVVLRNTVNAFRKQAETFVLSEDFKPIEWTKHAEFIGDIFDIDFLSKSLSSKINLEAGKIIEIYPEETAELLHHINSWGGFVSSQFDFNADFSVLEDSERIIKMLNFSVHTEDLSLPEMILEYMNICRKFFKKNLFVFLNLKSYLTVDEQQLFYKSAVYEKFNLLLIENYQHESIGSYEKNVIIDKDLCVI